MAYRIWIKDEAKSEVRALPGNVKQRARQAITGLGEDPRPADSREMRTAANVAIETRRLRLDRWRILYVVDDDWEEIGILAVRRRPPYDYDDLDDLLREIGAA